MRYGLIILFYNLFDLILNIYIYRPKDLLDDFNKELTPKSELDFITDKLSQVFKDHYAFYETSKTAPSYNKYQNKIDIKEEFQKIKNKNEKRSFYSFYQDISRLFGKLNDGHTHITFFNISNSIKFFNKSNPSQILSPIDLYINVTDGVPKMFGRPLKNQTLYRYFLNNETVLKVIKDSLKFQIKRINNKDPFDYIEDFGSEYFSLRNPHGTFTLSLNLFNRASLSLFPLTVENLTNFTVVYENGNKFSTDFIIIYKENLKSNISAIRAGFGFNNIYNEINYIYAPEFQELPYELINITEYGIEISKRHLNFAIQDNKETKKKSKIKWKYNFENIFKCGIYNETNIYFINSFMTEENDKFLIKIAKCAEFFDKNEYPIFLITSMNGGGLAAFSKYLIEILSPHSSSRFYNRIRKTQAVEDHDKSIYFTSDKCKLISSIDYLKETFMVEYSDKVKDNLTDLSILVDGAIRSKLDDIKYNLKNPRKPTDIIVFTDGFSFSATSIFLKLLQHSGGAITVGYFGNPKKRDKVIFDSSLSPSAIISTEQLKEYSTDFKELNEKYKVQMQFAHIQSFYDYNSSFSFPLEYEITPVDEKMSLFENFNEIINLDKFVAFGKNIIKKYKSECNSNNKKLYLLEKKCHFADKHMHGGYICGTDGKWDYSKCVPTYCDINYIFDHVNQKCVFNYCSIPPYNVINIIENSALAISILILIGSFIYLTLTRKKTKFKIISNDLINENNEELLN